jgi:hypothetical protein
VAIEAVDFSSQFQLLLSRQEYFAKSFSELSLHLVSVQMSSICPKIALVIMARLFYYKSRIARDLR